MSFDRIEHSTGLLRKIKFYAVYGTFIMASFFLIDLFLSSRRLNLTLALPLTLECLRMLSFFSCFDFLHDDVLCKIAIWADDNALNMIMLSTQHVTNHLTCRNKLTYTVRYFHVTYRVSGEFNSIVCLNVKGLLTRRRCHFWNLSDSNEIRTFNHLVRKGTLNHLAKWPV